MSIPAADRMSPEERRAGASLASIFALRMLGLFLILPVFSVYAKTLPGGDNLALVGFALGAYGLTQAFFQIPYGIASDIWGRKLVIVIGLLVFALGQFRRRLGAGHDTGSSSVACCRAPGRFRPR